MMADAEGGISWGLGQKDKVTILLMVKHKSSLDPKGPAFLVYETGFRNQARDGFY